MTTRNTKITYYTENKLSGYMMYLNKRPWIYHTKTFSQKSQNV